MKNSKITLDIYLNENNIPEKISCISSEEKKDKIIKSFMLSLWDPTERETLKIDLWTNDMLLDDIKIFIYQSILSMKEVVKKSLDNNKISDKIENFALEIAKEMDILKNNK